jgi:hypothetical protein
MRFARPVVIALLVALPASAVAAVGATAVKPATLSPQRFETAMTMPNALPLFYRELVAFDTAAHAHLALPATPADFRFAAATNVIPLLLHEIPLALSSYPLVFLPGGDKEPPTLAVLVGVGDGINRYLDTRGQWRADTYIPAWVRRYPFVAVQAHGQGDPVLAIDPGAEMLRAPGDALVKDGKPTPRLEFVLAFQQEFAAFAERTRAAVAALNAAGVLEEGRLSVTLPGGGETREITGFFIVGEARLKALDGKTLDALNKADALGIAYAQLLSMANLGKVLAGVPVTPPAANTPPETVR